MMVDRPGQKHEPARLADQVVTVSPEIEIAGQRHQEIAIAAPDQALRVGGMFRLETVVIGLYYVRSHLRIKIQAMITSKALFPGS